MFPQRDAKYERKPHGHIIIDGAEVAHTLRCVHCGAHWVSIHGSGTKRGFCMSCMGPTCGKDECDKCAPFEARLELTENPTEKKRKNLLYKYDGITRI